MPFLKFNSTINLSFFGSPCNKRSMYIKDFNCSWSKKSSHYRAALSNFRFISSKRIYSFVFVFSGGDSCCFGEHFNLFTFLFIISTWLFLLYLCIPISSSSLMLAALQCDMSASEFELEVLLVARLVWVLLFTKLDFLEKAYIHLPFCFCTFNICSVFQFPLYYASSFNFMIVYIKIHFSRKYNPLR